MPRDETRDVLIICDENGAPSNEYSGFWYHRTLTAKSLPIAQKDSLERFSPHSQLVDLERQLAACSEQALPWLEWGEAIAEKAGATVGESIFVRVNEYVANIERQLAELKTERDAAVHEMAKARQKATDCEAARDLTHWILYDRAEEVGGQFKRLYDEWSQMKRQLAESRAATDALDSELTKIRVALTAAGIPEVEPYPEEDVSDLERSLRAGGRVICATDRIKRLAESRAEVERLRGKLNTERELVNRITAESAAARVGLLNEDAQLVEALDRIVSYFEHETQRGNGISEEHSEGYWAAKATLRHANTRSAPYEDALFEVSELQRRASMVPGMSAELDSLRFAAEMRRLKSCDSCIRRDGTISTRVTWCNKCNVSDDLVDNYEAHP